MKLLRICFFFVLLFVSGCSSSQVLPPVGNASQANSATNQTAAPVPTNEPEPTRNPALATVKGKLLSSGKPVTNGIIYLTSVIQDDQGRDVAAGLDRSSPLRGYLDEQGNFVIINVPPGHYGIVLDLVSQGFLLNRPNKNESYIFDITKAENIDLGELNYPSLPQ